MDNDITSVMLVTKDEKISSQIMQMLVAPIFEVSLCSDYNDARRKVGEVNFNIIIVDVGDGEGTDFATDISENQATVLLLAPNHLFDQISYRVEAFGVLTLTKPFDQFYFYNMIKVALAVQAKVQRLMFQTIRLKEKMEEIRIINRAKMIMMSSLGMTENEAHHHIEKEAMNRGSKRIAVAEEIIRTYQ